MLAEDVQAMKREYASMLGSLEVHNGQSATIQTLEGDKFSVQLNAAGWTIVDGTGQGSVYETTEAMLMAQSGQFTQLWHEKLRDKLCSLERH